MYVFGIDLGGTNIAVGLLNEKYEMIAHDSTPTLVERGFDAIIDDMGMLMHRLLNKTGISENEIKYIGIGTPGTGNNDTGLANDNNNIGWKNFPLRAKIQKHLNKPVFMGNDANVAALAEYKMGSGKGSKNFLMLTLGTGVGGGLIIDGKLYTGSHFIGGELGHMVLRAGGDKCGCGMNGCIEAYCSASALIRHAKENLALHPESIINRAEKISARTVIDAAKAGDKYGIEIFDQYVSDLSDALTGFVNFLDPDVIALGGGVANAGEFLFAPLIRNFKQNAIFAEFVGTKLVKAEMGNDAGIIGAALLGEEYM